MLLASWRRRRGGVWKGRVCAELTWLWEASEDPPPPVRLLPTVGTPFTLSVE